ncbi:MAG: hypothetical protein AMXMBFR34_19950 [Myxococcaceae bacterium]
MVRVTRRSGRRAREAGSPQAINLTVSSSRASGAGQPPHERALASLVARLRWPRRRTPEELTPVLSEWLYQRYFIGWREPGRPREDLAGDAAFVAELLARVGEAQTWEAGFRVAQRTRAGAFVERDGLRLWVTDLTGLWPRPTREGQRVAVRVPCARESAIPGFFTVVSRAGRLEPGEPHLKLYLNVAPRAVPALLEGLVSHPSLRRARFEAKVGNEPAHYCRRDTALLYVDARDYRLVARWCLAFRRRHRSAFRAASPPMTWPLAPGLSAAESPPGDEESYGAQRCRLLAEALVGARQAQADWRSAVAARFAEEGLNWTRPWLGALAVDWTYLRLR